MRRYIHLAVFKHYSVWIIPGACDTVNWLIALVQRRMAEKNKIKLEMGNMKSAVAKVATQQMKKASSHSISNSETILDAENLVLMYRME